MIVDNASDILQVMLSKCGDVRLRKGRTQKYLGVEVHSSQEIGHKCVCVSLNLITDIHFVR